MMRRVLECRVANRDQVDEPDETETWPTNPTKPCTHSRESTEKKEGTHSRTLSRLSLSPDRVLQVLQHRP